MNKPVAAKIIFFLVVILGCAFVSCGLNGNSGLVFVGFVCVAAGIAAQVALVLIPVVKAIADKYKEKKEEDEEDMIGLGIK